MPSLAPVMRKVLVTSSLHETCVEQQPGVAGRWRPRCEREPVHPGANSALISAATRLRILIEDEMARVEPNQPSVRQIAQVRFRPCRNKERIVPAPDDQRSGPMRAECRMPGLVGRNIGLVVLQQIELGQINARAVQQGLVDGPVIGADRCGGRGRRPDTGILLFRLRGTAAHQLRSPRHASPTAAGRSGAACRPRLPCRRWCSE